jgi:hypothetical protein
MNCELEAVLMPALFGDGGSIVHRGIRFCMCSAKVVLFLEDFAATLVDFAISYAIEVPFLCLEYIFPSHVSVAFVDIEL